MILDWAAARGLAARGVHLYRDETPPPIDAQTLIVVMGGPMGVRDDEAHPWLAEEKAFLKEAVRSGAPVLGICLGAQLVSQALGAEVTRNPYKEIGYFPISLTGDAVGHPLFEALPKTWTPLHWHGDTFDIPEGGTRIARSGACANQGFIGPGPVMALQFHLEVDVRLAASWLDDLDDQAQSLATGDDGRFIQRRDELMASAVCHTEANRKLLYLLLDRFFLGRASGSHRQ
jgi:GMP synthase-like glutamine amidotransferase